MISGGRYHSLTCFVFQSFAHIQELHRNTAFAPAAGVLLKEPENLSEMLSYFVLRIIFVSPTEG